MQIKPWDGKLHKKIDFYQWSKQKGYYEYVCSTNQSRTLKEAAQKFYSSRYANGEPASLTENTFKITFSNSPKWFNLLPLVERTGRNEEMSA
jgi:hypothetical protein